MNFFCQNGARPLKNAWPFSLQFLNFGKFDAKQGCYSPSDLTSARESYKANCGPAAFSAIYRLSITDVMRFFPHFPTRSWTTLGDMKSALTNAGLQFSVENGGLPKYGLALLQLRINDRPLHPYFSLSQTHWVGVCENCFYDVNWGGWLPVELWEELVLADLQFGSRPVLDWHVRNSLSILNPEFREISLGVS